MLKENERYFLYEYNWNNLDNPKINLCLAEKISKKFCKDIYNFNLGCFSDEKISFGNFKPNHFFKFLHSVNTKDIAEIKKQYPEYFI